MVQAVLQLTGFKLVTLTLETYDDILQKDKKTFQGLYEDVNSCYDFEAFTVKMRSTFEPSLGPGSFGKIRTVRPHECYFLLIREVTFHPQAHLGTKRLEHGVSTETDTPMPTSTSPQAKNQGYAENPGLLKGRAT